MRRVLYIFSRDVGRLARFPLAFVIVIGMMALCCACAWGSIASVSSPYRHAGDIRVAVVDTDEGDEVAGLGEVDLGSLVAAAVREDGRFGWEVVDEATAREGLQSGDYYATIVLPPNFTYELASALKGGGMGEPTVEYWTNQKLSSAALDANDEPAGTLDSVIGQVFSTIVSNTVADLAKDASSETRGDEAAAASQAQAGLVGAGESVGGAQKAFDAAVKSISSWRESVKSAQEGLDGLGESLPGLQTSLSDARDSLADAREAAHKVDGTASSALGEGTASILATVQQIAEKVGAVADDLVDTEDDVATVGDAAREALDRNAEALSVLEGIPNPSSEVESAIEQLKEKNEGLADAVADLEEVGGAITDSISDATETADSTADDISSLTEGLGALGGKFDSEVMPKLDAGMDDLAGLFGSLEGAITSLSVQISQAKALLGELDDVLSQTKGSLSDMGESLSTAEESVEDTRASLAAVAGSEFMQKASEISGVDAETYSLLLAEPVTMQVEALYAPDSYGAMVAPFYSNVAIWAFVLMLAVVLRIGPGAERAKGARGWQAALARFLLFAALALIEALVMCAGELAFGVHAVHPAAFVGAGLVCALAFAGVVFALSHAFGAAGKALSLVLLALQVPAAAGAFPVGLAPGAFQALVAVAPFTFGMDAMGESLGGFYGSAYALDLLRLVGVALVVSAVALLLSPQAARLGAAAERKLAAAGVFQVGRGAVRDEAPAAQGARGRAPQARDAALRQAAAQPASRQAVGRPPAGSQAAGGQSAGRQGYAAVRPLVGVDARDEKPGRSSGSRPLGKHGVGKHGRTGGPRASGGTSAAQGARRRRP